MNDLSQPNGTFPSCCLSRFRSESWCSTIVREMSLICIRIRNSFPSEWLCTGTRFETEACSNSEMGYYYIISVTVHSPPSLQGMGVVILVRPPAEFQEIFRVRQSVRHVQHVHYFS